MSKSPFFYVSLLLYMGYVSSCQNVTSSGVSSPPNIIIIFADDLGYGDLGLYGHPTIHTPRLDQMAREGIKLTSFYAAAPVCTPSRAALMTGRLPLNVGLPGNLGPDSPGGLNPGEQTLAEALKDIGYTTAAFGKWHLGSVSGFFPTDHGFDEYFGIPYSNDMMTPYIRSKRPLHLYRDTRATEEYPVDQTTLTQRYSDEAIRVIKEAGDQPFFIYLPHSMPHLPVYASSPFSGKSAGGRYGDVIEEMDFHTGRILDALQETGKDENTLVVFTSDNGPWRNMPPRMYNTEAVEKWHGGTTGALYGAKATTYEGGMRVPCIIRWPGKIPAGQMSAQMASTMDLYATILGLTGATPPQKPLDGKDIWPLLTQNEDSPHQYWYYYAGKTLEAIRDREWKLRVAGKRDGWTSPELKEGRGEVVMELFNLADDPYEHFNLAKENPEVVATLRAEMEKHVQQTGGNLIDIPVE